MKKIFIVCVYMYDFLQLASQLPSDRELACRSLSHLVFDPPSVEQLLGLRLVRRVAPLLVDQTPSVREAAAGALR